MLLKIATVALAIYTILCMLRGFITVNGYSNGYRRAVRVYRTEEPGHFWLFIGGSWFFVGVMAYHIFRRH